MTKLSPPRHCWQKPPKGVIKLNWDAALNEYAHMMGVGILAHDSGGYVVATMCTTIPFITDPTMAEATAAWKAVLFCCEQGF